MKTERSTFDAAPPKSSSGRFSRRAIYGARNVLSYTRHMMANFLAFRDSPIIPLRRLPLLLFLLRSHRYHFPQNAVARPKRNLRRQAATLMAVSVSIKVRTNDRTFCPLIP